MQCAGWWEQAGYGRQAMEGLEVEFQNGELNANGSDVVGPFIMSGRLEPDGQIAIRKHYLGKHEVYYHGVYDGEGTFYGTWDIGGLHGNWSIHLVASNGDQEIQTLNPLP